VFLVKKIVSAPAALNVKQIAYLLELEFKNIFYSYEMLPSCLQKSVGFDI